MYDLDSVKQVKSFGGKEVVYYSLELVKQMGIAVEKLPYTIRILLENVLRNRDGFLIKEEDVKSVMHWPDGVLKKDIPYMPARTVLQDFTGVPLIVDLAAMRDAIHSAGGDPQIINPVIPTDLVIDHSVQVDAYGKKNALKINLEKEYERNTERYELIKWAQKTFKNFRVVPPGSGIVHQVNLEFLASVVDIRDEGGDLVAVIDSCIGTDSHTTMINGLGVIGWGVGGIEAEAVILGQPYFMVLPEVVGFRLTGELPEGATATDLVLRIVEILREKGVVGKFVEFFGDGISNLSVPDRATISNMAPEYGATMGFFPVDAATLAYLRLTGRDESHIQFVEDYTRTQMLFREESSTIPDFSDILDLDLASIRPSISGPLNPEERVALENAKARALKFQEAHISSRSKGAEILSANTELNGKKIPFGDGSLVIAAITSCTNTSNPTVMVGSALLAKNAVEKGLKTKPYVKTSFAPGSLVVTEYIKNLGLSSYLESLNFYTVGYGCTSCIGNSGPLSHSIQKAIIEKNLYTTSILSGNRNFSGRVHELTLGNYLASPMLVIAYALVGRMDVDLTTEALGKGKNGEDVYLPDIWPSQREIREAVESGLNPNMFKSNYRRILAGDINWQALDVPKSTLFEWNVGSTYIRLPPFFKDFSLQPKDLTDIVGARVLVLFDNKISTDHISPAGSIALKSPAGEYLLESNVAHNNFNSYGSRRGNHEVMMRGTFANVRVENQLISGKRGWWSKHFPTNEVLSTFSVAEKYRTKGVPLLGIGGEQYGQGSSRDWAAKGPALLGIKAIFAKSFERIHRSNLIGMGILPLQFRKGEGWRELGLNGAEVYDIYGLSDGLQVHKELTVNAKDKEGKVVTFTVTTRIDIDIEIEYLRYGGILQYIVGKLLKK